MNDGLLVRVTTGIDREGDPVIALWVVATTNRQAAIAIVREANPHALSVEIAERLLHQGRSSGCGCNRVRRAGCEVFGVQGGQRSCAGG